MSRGLRSTARVRRRLQAKAARRGSRAGVSPRLQRSTRASTSISRLGTVERKAWCSAGQRRDQGTRGAGSGAISVGSNSSSESSSASSSALFRGSSSRVSRTSRRQNGNNAISDGSALFVSGLLLITGWTSSADGAGDPATASGSSPKPRNRAVDASPSSPRATSALTMSARPVAARLSTTASPAGACRTQSEKYARASRAASGRRPERAR